jgi:hypothetical protein
VSPDPYITPPVGSSLSALNSRVRSLKGRAPARVLRLTTVNERHETIAAVMSACRQSRAPFKWHTELLVGSPGVVEFPTCRIVKAGEPNNGRISVNVLHNGLTLDDPARVLVARTRD